MIIVLLFGGVRWCCGFYVLFGVGLDCFFTCLVRCGFLCVLLCFGGEGGLGVWVVVLRFD